MLRKKKDKNSKGNGEPVLPELEFKPICPDKQQAQGLLVACRQVEQYPVLVTLIAQAISVRADQIVLDYTAQGASVRYRVDGMWETMPPMDRPNGDKVLEILKRLAGMNFADRRSKQKGKLPLACAGDWIAEILSQGTPNGERVLVRIEPKKPILKTLGDLGMRDKMQEQLKGLLNANDALVVISGAPSHGLPTTWRVALEAADRFVRDFHAIEDKATAEAELINITQHLFDSSAGETPKNILGSLLLKQPDVLVLPDFVNEEIVQMMMDELIEEHRHCITRIVAPTAAEAYVKLLTTYKKQAKNLIKTISCVLNVRLVRRLCEKCRQPFQPNPQLLQKLGIPAGRVTTMYQAFVPPPPDQRVDAKGNPIEIEICERCSGRGYFGRAGIFELLQITDEIRKVAEANPSVDAIVQVARKAGHRTLQDEGVLAVATGMTSLQEMQRIMAPAKT